MSQNLDEILIIPPGLESFSPCADFSRPLLSDRNHQRDKEFKLKLYSQHGVQEYWIVNWQLKIIEVYRHQEGILQFVGTLLELDSITSPLLPGFSSAIGPLFQ